MCACLTWETSNAFLPGLPISNRTATSTISTTATTPTITTTVTTLTIVTKSPRSTTCTHLPRASLGDCLDVCSTPTHKTNNIFSPSPRCETPSLEVTEIREDGAWGRAPLKRDNHSTNQWWRLLRSGSAVKSGAKRPPRNDELKEKLTLFWSISCNIHIRPLQSPIGVLHGT